MKKLFSNYKGIIILSAVAYASLYLCRLNIEPALANIQTQFDFSDTQLGYITSAFFWVYAVGQLVNGFVGKKVPTRFMAGIGLIGSALCNIIFSMMTTNFSLALVWAANGLFQSMLWGPLLKAIANWTPKEHLTSASLVMSLACIVGNAAANGFSGFMAARTSWQICFIIPAIITSLIGVVVLAFYNGEPAAAEDIPVHKDDMPFGKFILYANIPLIIIISVCNGCMRFGFTTWFPKLLNEAEIIDPRYIWIVLLLLPFVAFGVTTTLNYFKKHRGTPIDRLMLVMLSIALVISATMNLIPPAVSTVLFMVLMVLFYLCVTPVNSLITAYLPFKFADYSYVSVVGGMADFAIYVGSAISGYIIGGIGDRAPDLNGTLSGIAVFWFICGVVSVAAVVSLAATEHHKHKST